MMYKQQAFILIPVVIALAVVSSILYLMSIESAESVHISQQQVLSIEGQYLLASAAANARWRLKQNTSCVNYTPLNDINIGPHKFSLSYTPINGSPTTATLIAKPDIGSIKTSQIILNAYGDIRNKYFQYSNTYSYDSILDDTTPNANYNSDGKLKITNTANSARHAIIQFPTLPFLGSPTQVNTALLELYQENIGSGSNIPVTVNYVTSSWNDNQVTWQDRSTGTSWTSPGGDLETPVINNTNIDVTTSGWKSWDIRQNILNYRLGKVNNGLLLKATSSTANMPLNTVEFSSTNTSACAQRPRINVTMQCECGKTCKFVPRIPVLSVSCNMDHALTTTEISQFNISGYSDVFGVTYIPSCLEIFGVEVPTGGAYLLTDYGNKNIILTDVNGTKLAFKDAPYPYLRAATLIYSGTWPGYLATVAFSAAKVFIFDTDLNEVASFNTTWTTAPAGITHIHNSASGAHDGSFAVVSAKDDMGISSPTLVIVDQNGKVKQTIDITAYAIEPVDISHIFAQDKFLIADKGTKSVYKIDFAGNLLEESTSMSTNPQGVTIEHQQCNYVIVDWATKDVREYD